ncbi:MAG TPA: hypothetical protein DCZ01_04395 [Elusimicrobia bacterium]|nr:MAG: hypothetical protein A2X37_10615 [Elusimicrobia bacterium GWA2_66_18]OGR77223.1 MAG: hypothetical protein A2X40_01040 [Elusimicrobia bacterium GWC2_65_9]HAZ07764.1 hypothetical protein [Elusimicrobiota bacterium]
MVEPIRRAHARIPCDKPAQVFRGSVKGGLLCEARLLNLSLAGCYVRLRRPLEKGTSYRLKVTGPQGPVDLPCRMVREGPRQTAKDQKDQVEFNYGMLFNLTSDQEMLLRGILDVLRREPLSAKEERLERSLRDYWAR